MVQLCNPRVPEKATDDSLYSKSSTTMAQVISCLVVMASILQSRAAAELFLTVPVQQASSQVVLLLTNTIQHNLIQPKQSRKHIKHLLSSSLSEKSSRTRTEILKSHSISPEMKILDSEHELNKCTST